MIRIHQDTKTGAREVPFFGEIREIFTQIINSRRIGGQSVNLGDLVFGNLGHYQGRIVSSIRRSGVVQWAKLFVNLRSSCITDAVERGYQEKTLDAMFGNSAMMGE